MAASRVRARGFGNLRNPVLQQASSGMDQGTLSEICRRAAYSTNSLKASLKQPVTLCSRRRDVLLGVAQVFIRPSTSASRQVQQMSKTISAISPDKLKEAVQAIVPALTGDKYKGQAGVVGTIGGCREYTGAPYFASMSALKVGADLSHTFCTEGAATVIKSYAPDLIVHPYLPDSNDYTDELPEDKRKAILDKAVQTMEHWMPRFSVIVIGPGLGRDEMVHETVKRVILKLRELRKPMVIDADGLYIVTKNLDLVKGCKHVILTPNKNEYQRLADQLDIDLDDPSASDRDKLEKMCSLLDGPTLVRKGATDLITDGRSFVEGPAAGSPRRAGGQGDVMSGSIATFYGWATEALKAGNIEVQEVTKQLSATVLASYGGTLIARHAAQAAFAKRKRSMIAVDLIEELGFAVDDLFDKAS